MSNVVAFQPASQFDILFAEKGFRLGRRSAQEMPLILDPSGTLHEGATRYFIETMVVEAGTEGTARVAAYAIRDWLQYLHQKGVPWDKPSDQLLADWAADQWERPEEIRPSEERINDKISCVFRFYLKLQDIGAISYVVQDNRIKSSEDGSNPRPFLISSKIVLQRDGNRWARPSIQSRVRFKADDSSSDKPGKQGRRTRRKKRVTPGSDQVNAVFDELLDKSAKESQYARVRNFFCARVMAHMGLRREGTAQMSTTMLEKALADKGIRVPVFSPRTVEEREALLARGWKPHLQGLDAIADMADERDGIINTLSVLEHKQHLKQVYLWVTEKGRKRRQVPLPFKLLRSLLIEFVWDERKRFIEERRSRHPRYMPPSELWLSHKTGNGMVMAAIANEVKKAFKETGVDASGHRLRAYFLTELVRDLYIQARSIHGIMFDERVIFEQAADIAGHEDTEYLRPYLSRVVMEENEAPGEPVHVEKKDDAEMLRAFAEALNDGNEDLRELLKAVMAEFQLTPVKLQSSLADIEESLARRRAKQ
jgi:hypothetical protein